MPTIAGTIQTAKAAVNTACNVTDKAVKVAGFAAAGFLGYEALAPYYSGVCPANFLNEKAVEYMGNLVGSLGEDLEKKVFFGACATVGIVYFAIPVAKKVVSVASSFFGKSEAANKAAAASTAGSSRSRKLKKAE